jgi:hypothetical protein
MLWLALPMTVARHGMHLESVTATITITALVLAVGGAVLSIAGHLRGSAGLWAAGIFFFACSVAILMPLYTAAGFLGMVLAIVALRARFAPMRETSTLAAVLGELWPLGYAVGFAALAWRYNPQLLLKVLLIAFGVSLIARAVMPSREKGTVAANAGS